MAAQIDLVGNLTRDPELRFTPSGKPVVGFAVAVNERKKQGDQWVDGETSFFNVSAWEQLGENVASSFTKGDRVRVTGKIRQRSWESQDGERKTAYDVVADDVHPSLKYATVQVQKNEHNNRSVSTREVAETFDAPPPDDDERPF